MTLSNLVLTKKQLWRRVQLSPKKQSHQELTPSTTSSAQTRDRSSSDSSTLVTDGERGSSSGYTSDECLTPANQVRRPRCVMFSDIAQVVLVPSRSEYFECGANKDVWWTQEELQGFKSSAQCEAASALQKYDGDIYATLHALYQPETTKLNQRNALHEEFDDGIFSDSFSSLSSSLDSTSNEFIHGPKTINSPARYRAEEIRTAAGFCAHPSSGIGLGAAMFERRFGPIRVKGYTSLYTEQLPRPLRPNEGAVTALL
mmetsp:Transcript_19944/g.28664  ORF Transcript_19944/g.28664 Transcript_19944/m.28664 type:complete len:258 (-) Transcript_19944:46-819(-)